MALPVFPSLIGLAWPVPRTAKWSGSKNDALSGKRVRTTYMTYPIYAYEFKFSVLRTASQEWQNLEGFIDQVFGAASMWLYNDPNDNVVSNQGFGQGDGATTTFQLVRTLGGFTAPVFFPNIITDIKVAGTPTVAYTLPGLGIVSFNSAPAAGAALTWDGTFYWPCRFDDEAFGFENFMQNLFRMKSLHFSTEKLP
jgi:hypothetical protein